MNRNSACNCEASSPLLQVWYPLLRFSEEEDIEAFTVAPEAAKTYTSKKGYPCKSDRDIASTTADVTNHQTSLCSKTSV